MRRADAAVAALTAALVLVATAGASPGTVRIGVILKGLDNPFFVAMYEGARAEAGQRHVSASFRAATDVNDVSGQTKRARVLVATGKHDCFFVNPMTPTNLVAAFAGVKRPIVNVDSPLDRVAARRAGMRVVTFIGTDDEAAGGLAAKEMAKVLHGRGEVALLNGYADSRNSNLRLRGFRRGVARTHIKIVAEVVADYDRAKAQLAARSILRQHPHLAGFFAANDVMALGVADIVAAAGERGAVKVIGVDGIPPALDAIRSGLLTASVAQYPYVMGRLGIEACIASVRGARLPARVNAPIVLVTSGDVEPVNAAFPLPPNGYRDPFARLLH
jgi:ribose transport system substrate-binding protein